MVYNDDMKVQSRYVEYIGRNRVVEGVWVDHRGGNCPEGCLDVGFPLHEARKWKKWYEREEEKAGCSNFEYRVTELGEMKRLWKHTSARGLLH